MTTYMIGYDLHPSKGESYDELIKAIKAYGTWCHPLDSTWFIVTTSTAVQVRDNLVRYIKSDDQLLVLKSGQEAAWFGFTDEINKWLKDNL